MIIADSMERKLNPAILTADVLEHEDAHFYNISLQPDRVVFDYNGQDVRFGQLSIAAILDALIDQGHIYYYDLTRGIVYYAEEKQDTVRGWLSWFFTSGDDNHIQAAMLEATRSEFRLKGHLLMRKFQAA